MRLLRHEYKIMIACVIVMIILRLSRRREGMDTGLRPSAPQRPSGAKDYTEDKESESEVEDTVTKLLKKENACISGVPRKEGMCVDSEGKEVSDSVQKLMEPKCCEVQTNKWIRRE